MSPKPLVVSRMYDRSILKYDLIKLILNLDCLIPCKSYQKIYCKDLYFYKCSLPLFLTDQNSVAGYRAILQNTKQCMSYTLKYSYQRNGGITLKYPKMGKILGE